MRKELIQNHFENPNFTDPQLVEAIESTINDLDNGRIRVAEKIDDQWKTNEWIKQAILLYFRFKQVELIESGAFQFVDKIPVKKFHPDMGVRVVPQGMARYGSYIAPGAIMMPGYVNIGAYVDTGTMVDTWATVGSCAQIGKNVHLSGGVGIGGVLEPIQASPVIVEDNCFIGSRCIIVEGVHIEESAVIGAGVSITASTKIIDVSNKDAVIYRKRVPKNSVVIPGTQNKEFPGGTFGVSCALIIGQRKESTNKKTSLTEALREYNVSV